MQRWEYFMITLPRTIGEGLLKKIDELGAEGWELVVGDKNRLWFKRLVI